MTNRRIKEMMQNIDPKYQQKADERAAAVTHTAHRSRIPSLLVCGAAACCAAFAAAIIVPKLKAEQIQTAMSETQDESAEDSQFELITEPAEKFELGTWDAVRLMSPAYAPYVLDISAEQQDDLSMELTAAIAVAELEAKNAGTVWQPCDPDMPIPDGENYSIFVYNGGEPYRLTVYSDNTIDFDRGDSVTRWQFPEGIYTAVAAAANPAQPEANESYAKNPLEGHLTWCREDTINAKDIWQNTNVAAKECDMTTQDGVFYKVRNTMDYYNRASGVIISATKPDGSNQFMADRSTFCTDLNAGKASEYLEYFYSADAEKLMNGCEGCTKDENGVFITAKEDGYFYTATEYNHKGSIMPGTTYRIDCPPVENDDCKPEQMEFDDFDFYNSRRQILEGMALNSFEFSKLILGYLYEFDRWEIVGTEEANGRSCVHIKGTVSDRCIFRDFVKDYDMYVDEATGAIVKLLSYNENGELSHFVNLLNLKFEDDAEPFALPDFSDYEMFEMTDPGFAAQPDDSLAIPETPGEPVTDIVAAEDAPEAAAQE